MASSGLFDSSSRFTFLATLFLLLFVSTAIVLRSFFLRRRLRRRLREALDNGTLFQVSSARLFRTQDKPRLWDACLSPAHGGEWACLMPIAGRIASRKPGREPSSSPSEAAPAPPSFFRRMTPNTHTRTPSSPSPSRSDEDVSKSPRPGAEDPLASASALQLSLLIAMPNPRHPQASTQDELHSVKGKEKRLTGYWDEEEEGVPDVVLGVARVGLGEEGARSDRPS